MLLMVLTGCGSGSSGSSSSTAGVKVSDFERTFSIDDVIAVGWKRGKTYDVKGLDGAEAAYLGFWTPAGRDP
jgi:hypothetical protein